MKLVNIFDDNKAVHESEKKYFTNYLNNKTSDIFVKDQATDLYE